MAIFKRSTSNDPEEENKSSGFREILSFLGIILLALAFAFLIITFVFRSYSVDGPSMEPTLQNENKLIVWKLPRTWAMITGHQYVPKRGDIIIFNEANLAVCGQNTSHQLVKRVIGLPGNKVVIGNGKVMIYDHNHPHGFDPDLTLGYNKTRFIPYTTGDETIQLNSHQLFVLGDNRTVSCDSRYFGPINTSQVVGQLVLRILPLSEARAF